MPISWTAEVDQRLFIATMEACGITISSAQYNEISQRMGEGFTVEAIKHRFRKIKSQNGGSGGGAPRKAPKKTKTAGKKSDNGNDDVGNDDGDGVDKARRSSARKRAVKNYTEPPSDDDEESESKMPESPTKKIKQDEGEDGIAMDRESSFFAQAEQV